MSPRGGTPLASLFTEVHGAATAKRRLSRAITSPVGREQLRQLATGGDDPGRALRHSPLGAPALERSWQDLELENHQWGTAGSEASLDACRRWIGSAAGARWVATRLIEPARHAALRQRRFLVERRACLARPTRARCRVLAAAATAFLDDLEAETRALARARRELMVRGRRPLTLDLCGAGEISRVLALGRDDRGPGPAVGGHDRVYKRIPTFPQPAMAREYVSTYVDYCRRLTDAGIRLAGATHHTLPSANGGRTIFVSQARSLPWALAPACMAHFPVSDCVRVFAMILDALGKIRRYNRRWQQRGVEVALDGHIANWAIDGLHGSRLGPDATLVFLDTNSPMMRIHGQFRLPVSIHEHMLGVPTYLRPLSRPISRAVLARYFKPRAWCSRPSATWPSTDVPISSITCSRSPTRSSPRKPSATRSGRARCNDSSPATWRSFGRSGRCVRSGRCSTDAKGCAPRSTG